MVNMLKTKCTNEMYNTELSLYVIPPFEQFPKFFGEYQQDFSLMSTLYGINVCYYFYILWSHFSKVIYKGDFDDQQTGLSQFKGYLRHYKEICATEKVITATLKNI